MNKLLINPECPGCIALSKEVEALKQFVLLLQGQVNALEEEVAKARKNSSNSSKPPSSDIVKPKKHKKGGKRKKGGQRGHTKYERVFNLEEADAHHTYTLTTCPSCCSDRLDLLDGADKIDFQYELVDQPVKLHAHQLFSRS